MEIFPYIPHLQILDLTGAKSVLEYMTSISNVFFTHLTHLAHLEELVAAWIRSCAEWNYGIIWKTIDIASHMLKDLLFLLKARGL